MSNQIITGSLSVGNAITTSNITSTNASINNINCNNLIVTGDTTANFVELTTQTLNSTDIITSNQITTPSLLIGTKNVGTSITSLESRMTTGESNINNLLTKTTNQSFNSTTGQTTISGILSTPQFLLNGVNLDSRLTTDETNIGTLQTKLANWTTDVSGNVILSKNLTMSGTNKIFLNGNDVNTRLNNADDKITILNTKTQNLSSTSGTSTFTGNVIIPSLTLNSSDLNTRLTTDESNVSVLQTKLADWTVDVSGNVILNKNLTMSGTNKISINGNDLNTRLVNHDTQLSNLNTKTQNFSADSTFTNFGKKINIGNAGQCSSNLPHNGLPMTDYTLCLNNTEGGTGKGVCSILFQSSTSYNSDGGRIMFFDSVGNYPPYNYFNEPTTNLESACFTISCQNDASDTLLMQSLGPIILDSGQYNTYAIPSTSNRSINGNIIIQPNGGQVLIGKKSQTDNGQLEVNGDTVIGGKLRVKGSSDSQFDNGLIVNGILQVKGIKLNSLEIFQPQTFSFTGANITINLSRGCGQFIVDSFNAYSVCNVNPTLSYIPIQMIPSNSTIIWKPVNNAQCSICLPVETTGNIPDNYVLYFYVDSSSTMKIISGSSSSHTYRNSGAQGVIRYGGGGVYATEYNLGGYVMITVKSIYSPSLSLNVWSIQT